MTRRLRGTNRRGQFYGWVHAKLEQMQVKATCAACGSVDQLTKGELRSDQPTLPGGPECPACGSPLWWPRPDGRCEAAQEWLAADWRRGR